MDKSVHRLTLLSTLISAALFAVLPLPGVAQTNVATSVGITGDEDSNVGAFGGLDLLFDDKNWLAGSLGINRPTEGFEDSRSLTASVDYGHIFNAWSLSIGASLGDREGFSSKRLRGALQWQSTGGLLLGAQVEESRMEATTYVSGITRVIELQDDFSVTGVGARAGYYGESGFSLDLSFMSYDEPAGLRFRNVDQLTARLLSAEVDRLVADGRVNPLQVENRISQMQPRSYSNATSVLSDSLALTLGFKRDAHEFGVDFYRDTYALVDADMNTWDVRWMFPLTNENNLLELYVGSSELEGSSSAFGGLRFVFYR